MAKSADLDELLADLARRHLETQALLDATTTLRELPDALRAAVDADLSFTGQRDLDGEAVISNLAAARTSGLRGLAIKPGLGVGGQALELGRPVWVEDYANDSSITHDYDVPVLAEGICAVIAVPLVHRGQVLGVAYAGMRRPRVFGDLAVGRLESVAARAAVRLHVADAAAAQTDVALEAQRRLLAAELHDSLGALLFNIGAQVRDLQGDYPEGGVLVDRLVRIEEQISEATSTLRGSLSSMHRSEPSLALAASAQQDCRAFQERTGVTTRLIALTDLPDLETHRAAALVAAGREAMFNVEKHARASSVVLTLAQIDGGVLLAVTDDGVGEAASGSGDGFGLAAATERLARVGGKLSLVHDEDGGTTVRVWVPLV